MKTTMYFVVENGNVLNFITDSETEIDRAKVKYGNIFFNRTDAIKFAQKPIEKKSRHLTEEEANELEIAQFRFYLETENITGEQADRKWRAFWSRYNKNHWKERRLAYGN